MTNKEKFKEVFEKTFGYTPENSFPCPEECPEGFKENPCDGCPYEHIQMKEYKKPETEKDLSNFLLEMAGIMNDFSSALIKHSPIKERELFGVISLFMDVVTEDYFPSDNDLAVVKLDLAQTFYEAWPHSVEYYKKGEKE